MSTSPDPTSYPMTAMLTSYAFADMPTKLEAWRLVSRSDPAITQPESDRPAKK